MAATKVMKFWAVCLAMLGKLLAALGVSATASAARRDAALYERTLGNGKAGSDAPEAEAPEAVSCAAPDRGPGTGTPAVPAPRAVPLYCQAGPARRMFARPELPPTIKQRISAEAHGTSPGLRTRLRSRTEPTADEFAAPDSALAPVGTGPDAGAEADARPAAIPAARRHVHTARAV
ncbi:DUF6344 domain-containing protein [Streptomyces lydicus]|uniref:DUF6344 domain-containing protein n=1 Tax=Streptomyces lydicus TaxID=47763 RepID=UPI001010A18E|nr:DUF6344 domain-containing protein [Streptomyces lydicus]MCZ1008890.1 DUF6344 domain-containing protein [Streptomyces lydicus]